jgi:hypothetical protein
MGQTHALAVSRNVLEVEGEKLTVFQMDFGVDKISNAQLRALQK